MLQWWQTIWGVSFFSEPVFVRLVVILLITSLLHVVARFTLYRLLRVAARSQSYADDVITYAAMKPVPAAIWLLGLCYMGKTYARAHQLDEWLELIAQLRSLGLILLFGWFFWLMVSEFRQQIMVRSTRSETEVDQTTVDALCKLGHLVIFLVTLLTLLQTMGVSISGLLAAGGISGIAIGFAAKDILANFFGGLTIYLDRPFSVGDWIRSPDKDIEGTVEMISWRHTRIRRFNKNPIYVPNMLFTTITVENPSRMSHRRIRETVGIRYDDIARVPAIVSAIRDMLQHHPDIDSEQTLIVNFDTFSTSSLNILIYTFTKTRVWTEYHYVKEDVLLKVAEIITAHGAKLALPTHTLHMHPAPGE